MAAQQPKKPSRNKGGGASKVPGLNESVDTAVKWLKTPEVQEQLLDLAMKFADKVKTRAAQRPPRAVSRGDASEGQAPQRRQLAMPAVSPQRRLERNTDKLAANVALLRSAQGEASNEALDQVEVVIGRIRLALAVAKNLPTRRRVARQREIAVALRQVEDALMAATGLSDLTDVADPLDEPSSGGALQSDVDGRFDVTESAISDEGESAP